MADEKKRVRKPNWSKAEIASLIDAISFHQAMILSKFRTTDNNRKKQLAWGEIAQSVRAQSDGVGRTVEEIKKKWKDLVSQAKKDVHARKYPKTGGGPKADEGEFTNLIVDIFGGNNPIFHGIEEGGESGGSQSQASFLQTEASSQAETSAVMQTIPVEPGVPFSLEDVMVEMIEIQSENTPPGPASSKLPRPRSSTPICLGDDIEVLTVPVKKPTPPLRTSPQKTVDSANSLKSTGKRKVVNLGGPDAKASKRDQVSYEDLLQVEVARAELEKEKLSMEIVKLKTETEKFCAEIRKIHKEEELLELQIEAAKRHLAKSERRKESSRFSDVIVHCTENDSSFD